MAILSTNFYKLKNEQDAQRFEQIAKGMESRFSQLPGFQRAVVTKSVDDPMTYVVLSWWDSEEAMAQFGQQQEYRSARSESGGDQMDIDVEAHRWRPAE
jgi:heme-degrading monooxygenase HmoA